MTRLASRARRCALLRPFGGGGCGGSVTSGNPPVFRRPALPSPGLSPDSRQTPDGGGGQPPADAPVVPVAGGGPADDSKQRSNLDAEASTAGTAAADETAGTTAVDETGVARTAAPPGQPAALPPRGGSRPRPHRWLLQLLAFVAVGLVVLAGLGVLTVALLQSHDGGNGRTQRSAGGVASGSAAPSPSSASAATQLSVIAAGELLRKRESWWSSAGGTGLAIDGNDVSLTRSTPTSEVWRLAPTQAADWTNYRVTTRVSGLRDDLAHGGAALRVLVGSPNPVEC